MLHILGHFFDRLLLATIPSTECDLRQHRCSLHGTYPLNIFQLHIPDIWSNQAASGVSSSYDSLVDLFECLGNFLKRLEIYTEIPFTPLMTDIIVKILVELLSVLGQATKQVQQGRLSKWVFASKFSQLNHRTEKFAKKLLGESEIEAILQKLDRLTQEEARMMAAHTLEVVHRLVNNVNVVMNGTWLMLGLVRMFR